MKSTELECLAVTYALETFRHYLKGNPFEILTDHCALCFVTNKEKLSPRLHRWAVFFGEFDFRIKHKKGKQNADADCLSRSPVETPADEEDEQRYFAFATLDTAQVIRNHQENDETIAGHLKQLAAGAPSPYTLINGLLFRVIGSEKRPTSLNRYAINTSLACTTR
jgi:hypothetical protein